MPDAMFVVRLLLALTCVVGLIWYIGRRFGDGGPKQQRRTSREPGVKLVGRQSMSRHTGVAVVAVGQRRILVGYGEQQVTMLTELAPVFEEMALPQATSSTTGSAPDAGAPAPWVSAARATKAAAVAMLPTQRSRRSATPGALTPTSLAAAGVPTPAPAPAPKPVAPRELDASPLDRLDQADWPTHEDAVNAPEPATPAVPSVPSVPSVPAVPVADTAPTSSDGSKSSPLAGSILAPDTWRQAVRSLQDRSVRR